jgi:hypothetical protein
VPSRQRAIAVVVGLSGELRQLGRRVEHQIELTRERREPAQRLEHAAGRAAGAHAPGRRQPGAHRTAARGEVAGMRQQRADLGRGCHAQPFTDRRRLHREGAPAGGTYSVTWTATPAQGAACYLIAVQ